MALSETILDNDKVLILEWKWYPASPADIVRKTDQILAKLLASC
jgi:hypothetical protein